MIQSEKVFFKKCFLLKAINFLCKNLFQIAKEKIVEAEKFSKNRPIKLEI